MHFIIKKTGLYVEGLDYKEIAKYIRMNLTDQEITERRLMRVMPTRRYKRGRMPGMTGSEALQKTEEGEERCNGQTHSHNVFLRGVSHGLCPPEREDA